MVFDAFWLDGIGLLSGDVQFSVRYPSTWRQIPPKVSFGSVQVWRP